MLDTMLSDLEVEISSDEGLQPCQLMALCSVREAARLRHEEALPRLRERATRLSFSPVDVDSMLEWIKKQASIVIPIDLEKIGFRLAEDTHFRNQFETESCDALEDWRRAEMEEVLFGGAYHDAPASARCKSGVLSLKPNTFERKSGSDSTPWSYLVLRNVRHRTTIAFPNCDLEEEHSVKLATVDYYAHMLEGCTDAELCAALRVANGCDASIIDSSKELSMMLSENGELHGAVKLSMDLLSQIHGDVKLSENVELVMVNPKLRSRSSTAMVEKVAARCEAPFIWMEEESLQSVSSASDSYGTATPGMASPPLPALTYPVASAPAPGPSGCADDDLQEALTASLQFAEAERHARQKEAEDVARAMELSAVASDHASPSAEEESSAKLIAQALEASMVATKSAVATISSAAAPPGLAAVPADSRVAFVGSNIETEYGLKASLLGDIRRSRLSWSSAASAEEITAAIDAAVQKIFDWPMTELSLKYEDDDGDLCTLAKETVPDYLSLCQGSVLRQLHVCKMLQEAECIGDARAAEEASTSDEWLAVGEDEDASSQEPGSGSSDEGIPAVLPVQSGKDPQEPDTPTRFPERPVVTSDGFELTGGAELTNGAEVTADGAELATPPIPQFSMMTPPGSPRGQPAETSTPSSIEHEYTDEYISWSFVALPAE